VTVLELDGVNPPHGATPSLLMLSPRGGGVFTMKCAEASGVRRMPNNDTSLNGAIMTAKKTLGW